MECSAHFHAAAVQECRDRFVCMVKLALMQKGGSGKRVFLVHGWASSPEDCWFPWIREELEARGYDIRPISFPDPKHPDPARWLDLLRKEVGAPDEQTYFIAHSLGGYIVLKFLEKLSQGEDIGGAVIVGSRMAREGLEPADAGRLGRFASKVKALFSDNDYYIPLSEEKRFREELGAETLVLRDRGHFSRKEGTTELPEALAALEALVGEN